MKQLAFVCIFLLAGWQALAQHFEVLDIQEGYQTTYNQQIRVPIHLKNNTDKAQFYVIRKVKGDFGDTQKGYFCIGFNCLDASIVEFTKRIEPGETLQDLVFTFESGIQSNQTTLKFEFYPKGSPHEVMDRSVTITVEEKPTKSYIFQSKEITVQDVYPNPVQDHAFIEYKLHTESVKARVTLHNIFGKIMSDYDLPSSETRVKIQADELVSGVYFYTVYLNNNGILTRKLLVRK